MTAVDCSSIGEQGVYVCLCNQVSGRSRWRHNFAGLREATSLPRLCLARVAVSFQHTQKNLPSLSVRLWLFVHVTLQLHRKGLTLYRCEITHQALRLIPPLSLCRKGGCRGAAVSPPPPPQASFAVESGSVSAAARPTFPHAQCSLKATHTHTVLRIDACTTLFCSRSVYPSSISRACSCDGGQSVLD